MRPKELRAIRDQMGLTQAEFAERLRIARNTVARMERSLQAITPPMELLIRYVAREAGVDIASDQKRSRRKVMTQRKVAGKPKGNPVRSHGSRPRKGFLPR